MIEVQDKRQCGWLWLDNEILDIYAPKIGVYGLAVYVGLARHANGSRACWPSYETLATELGMSRRKVIDVVKELIAVGLIEVTARNYKTDDGATVQQSNVFTLLDVHAMHSGSEQHAPPLVNTVHQGSEQHAPKQDSMNKTQLNDRAQSAEPATETAKADAVDEKPKRRRKNPRTSIPADFTVTDPMRGWAHDQGHGDNLIDKETTKFIKSAYANGRIYADWGAAWENWLLNVDTFSAEGSRAVPPQRPPVVVDIAARQQRAERQNMPRMKPRQDAIPTG